MSSDAPGLSRFDGPLDLLLDLIHRRTLDITTISLAAVAEQYLVEVANMGETDLERLAGYLVIASKLLLIKSQALLPRGASTVAEEEEDAADLLRQLAEYQRFKELARRFREIEELQRRAFPRQAPLAITARPLAGLGSPTDLVGALRRALALAPDKPKVEVLHVRHFPVSAKLREIGLALEHCGELSFTALVLRAKCRPEVVAYFLALLELLRRGVVTVAQEGLFGEILLAKAVDGQGCDADQPDSATDGLDSQVDEAWLAGPDEAPVQLVPGTVEKEAEPGR